MADKKAKRLSKIAKEFNVGIHTIVDFLHKKGMEVESNPNTKIAPETYDMLLKEYSSDINLKKDSEKLHRIKSRSGHQSVSIEDLRNEEEEEEDAYENEDVLLIADTGVSPSNSDKKESQQESSQDQSTSSEKETPKQEKQENSENKKQQEAAAEEEEAKEKSQKEAENEAPTENSQNEKENTSDQKFRVVGTINLDEINEKTRPKQSANKKSGQEKTQPKQVKAKQNSVKQDFKTQAPQKKEETEKNAGQKAKKTQAEKDKTKEKEEKPKAGETQAKDTKSSDKQQHKEQSKQTEKKPRPTKEEKPNKEEQAEQTTKKQKAEEKPKEQPQEQKEQEKTADSQETSTKNKDDLFKTKVEKLSGPTVVGKINLEENKTPKNEKGKKSGGKDDKNQNTQRKRRRRIKKEKQSGSRTQSQQSQDQKKSKSQQTSGDQKDKKAKPSNKKTQAQKQPHKDTKRKNYSRKRKKAPRKELNEEDIQKQVKETLARLEERKKKSNKRTKRIKREQIQKRLKEEEKKQEEESNILKVTEFISVNELAKMLNVHPNQVIAKCMELGMVVNINQRLDAETISVIADEYNYKTEFISIDEEEEIEEPEEEEDEEGAPRPPIVTVMGHVDHGKTSLLDYIRSANVISDEAGGITQHIGAYHVSMEDGRHITFIDTPGHQAFTSMRARGAQVTDIAIIVVAADDDIMPQTKEAINHAEAAGVPIVFAINKIDKPNANPHTIKEKLAQMNYLVEEWGGKYLSADISAIKGENVEELMELVLLQAEMQELKADKDKKATGTVIEASLDKGRGYVTTVLVQSGTLKIGDYVLAGSYSGRIKAMFNERGQNIKTVEPSYPAAILGLDGSPQPGDKYRVLENEKEAREIANKRKQLEREQTFRTQRPMTLDEIGRRIAIGNFQEVNVIIKGDFDGSIEALSDSLMKLSTQEVQVKIIHKGVGEISESDVMLASASKALIVGFNVRPSSGARKMAEQQGIEIRLYSIIYDAINDMKDALEGMLDPEIKEEVVGTAEVRETFKISKVGTIAGCMIKEGKISRNNKVRVIRDGIVIYTGELGSLKRYKEDTKEVPSGYECGLNVDKFNDVKVGDIIEAYKEKEVKRSLEDTK